jgi:hypothetical protein
MPMKPVHLKGKNAAYLWSFIGAHFAIFLSLFVSKQMTAQSVDHFWKQITAKGSVIAACMPIFGIVLSGILGDQGKARIVFWRWRDPLPGCRVFSKLTSTDPRINADTIKSKHGKLPRDSKAQNALWYKIYTKHQDNIMVRESHKAYLLTRDLTAISAIFAVVLPIGLLLAPVKSRLIIFYLTALVAEFCILAMVARNYGERFVLNVLALESNSH